MSQYTFQWKGDDDWADYGDQDQAALAAAWRRGDSTADVRGGESYVDFKERRQYNKLDKRRNRRIQVLKDGTPVPRDSSSKPHSSPRSSSPPRRNKPSGEKSGPITLEDDPYPTFYVEDFGEEFAVVPDPAGGNMLTPVMRLPADHPIHPKAKYITYPSQHGDGDLFYVWKAKEKYPSELKPTRIYGRPNQQVPHINPPNPKPPVQASMGKPARYGTPAEYYGFSPQTAHRQSPYQQAPFQQPPFQQPPQRREMEFGGHLPRSSVLDDGPPQLAQLLANSSSRPPQHYDAAGRSGNYGQGYSDLGMSYAASPNSRSGYGQPPGHVGGAGPSPYDRPTSRYPESGASAYSGANPSVNRGASPSGYYSPASSQYHPSAGQPSTGINGYGEAPSSMPYSQQRPPGPSEHPGQFHRNESPQRSAYGQYPSGPSRPEYSDASSIHRGPQGGPISEPAPQPAPSSAFARPPLDQPYAQPAHQLPPSRQPMHAPYPGPYGAPANQQPPQPQSSEPLGASKFAHVRAEPYSNDLSEFRK